MARRFRGEGRQKLDAKGRVSIPAQFRRVVEAGDPEWTEGLRPEINIVYGDPRRKYLECYTAEGMAELERLIEALPRGSARRKTLAVEMLARCHTTEIDADGRLILPQKCRDKAGLLGEAYFIGVGDTFQIWNPDTFDAAQSTTRSVLDEMPEDEDILSLLDDPGGS